MKRDEKLKILRQLSQTHGERAEVALGAELKKVREKLNHQSDYHGLNAVLEELSVYAFRVHSMAIRVILSFLERIESIDIEDEWPEETLGGRDFLKRDLIAKSLDVLGGLRYFEIEEVLKVFVQYSTHDDEGLRKKSIEGLRRCAAYEVDVYFSGDNRVGLGCGPQLKVVSFLEVNRETFLAGRVEALATLARELLSPTIDGTSWDYQSVTWNTGPVPVSKGLCDIRSRTLAFVKSIYRIDLSEGTRKSLINTLFTATETPRVGGANDNLQKLIESNTLEVLNWVKSIVLFERFSILQKLESDVYWCFYHGISQSIRSSALEVRDLLYSNEEFQIYRNLIGFESVFEDWEESLYKERDFSQVEEGRKVKAKEYLQNISSENWPEWKNRILRFCETRTNDLAAFPLFYDFLHSFAEAHPDMAMELVRDCQQHVEFFRIPMLRGVWGGRLHEEVREYLFRRVAFDQDLLEVTRVFLSGGSIDEELLEKVLEASSRSENSHVLSQILLVAASLYEKNSSRDYAINTLFVPAMKKLARLGESEWVSHSYFNSDFRSLVGDLEGENLDLVLSALEGVKRVSYEVEELLRTAAERSPDRVLDFFNRRIHSEKRDADFEAIPYSLQRLKEPLSKHSLLVVDTLRDWFLHSDYLFQFRGGRLLSIIFPEFGEEIEEALLPLAKSGDLGDAEFVIAVLRNFHGEPFLHQICREIIVAFPEETSLKAQVAAVLYATGVVSGEFGFADAYALKAREIGYWLSDESEPVRAFAQEYLEMLTRDEASERERAREDIELRKHKFGARDDGA